MKLFQKASAAVLAVCGVLSAVPGAQAAGCRICRAGALAALSECCAAGCGFIRPRSGRSAAFPFAGFTAGNDPADGALLCRCPAVPAAFGPAFFSGRRSGRQCAFGTGSGCRVRHPFMGRPDDPRAAGVRADDRMERLPSGVPSGLQRGAHRRRRSKCRCSGKRSAADRAMFPCTVHGYSRPSAAAKLSCGQHGVLHQYPERAFRYLPRHRCTAGKKGCAGPAAFLRFYWGCSVQ